MRIALVGSRGMLARAVRELAPVTHEVHGYARPDLDVGDRDQVLFELEHLRPGAIINCAGYTAVDAAEAEEEAATRVNGGGPAHLAEAAARLGAALVHISSDYVFDGEKPTAYRETDPPSPLSAYGRSKLAGERAILAADLPRYFIVRTSWLYGAGGQNFVETILALARQREELRVVADQVGSPTHTRDLATAIFALLALPLAERPSGIYHFSSLGECSWHGFATAIVEQARRMGEPLACSRVVAVASSEWPRPARRPANSVLSKEKYLQTTGRRIPHWQEGLTAYLQERLAAHGGG